MLTEVKTLLYASDTRPGSRPAFRMAVQEAIKHQAKIVYLHVLEPVTDEAHDMMRDYLPADVQGMHLDQIHEAQRQKIAKRISDFLAEELDSNLLACEPEILVKLGRPDKGILKACESTGADMIVMGDRVSHSFSRFFLGSTAQSVIQHSQIPVLIVPLKPDSKKR